MGKEWDGWCVLYSFCSTSGDGANGSHCHSIRYHSNCCCSSCCCSSENSSCCPSSSIRSGSIHSGSYCTGCRDCCTGCCSLENSSCFLWSSIRCSILIDSYRTDCSNFHRCNSLGLGKGRIVQRLGCYLLRLSLRQERQPMRVLWHHVSSYLHISPLRH